METRESRIIEQRRCGQSDLTLSALGTGCWAFGGGEYWGEQSQKNVDAVVRRAVELGVTYFDTAEAYNEGRSESSLGQALRGIDRQAVQIGTKVSPSNTYPAALKEHCEASLRRLGTDYIDLYMIHWPVHPHSIRHFTQDEAVIRNPPAIDDAVEALIDLQEAGKIRYLGISNFSARPLAGLLQLDMPVVVNELPYSLLTRAIECEILPYCYEQGIGVIGYMTLLQGVLADIYPTLSDVPDWQRRTRHFSSTSCSLSRHRGDGAEEETNRALEAIRQIARRNNITVPALALKWALARREITCALVGARNVQELEANVEAAAEPLAPAAWDDLNRVTECLKEKMGPSFDYYESCENDRTI